MDPKTQKPADAPDAAAAATPVETGLRYRILPKGDGEVFTGEMTEKGPATFKKGDIVEGADPANAIELEERGWVEIL